jgi:hypothetical protein
VNCAATRTAASRKRLWLVARPAERLWWWIGIKASYQKFNLRGSSGRTGEYRYLDTIYSDERLSRHFQITDAVADTSPCYKEVLAGLSHLSSRFTERATAGGAFFLGRAICVDWRQCGRTAGIRIRASAAHIYIRHIRSRHCMPLVSGARGWL